MQLFRRPLTEAEHTHYATFFTTARKTQSFVDSAGLLLEAMLSSPQFLFLDAPSGESHALNGWQVATRLATLQWQSAPDAPLLEGAGAGTLSSEAAVANQVERMLADLRAERAVHAFFTEWLSLDSLARIGKLPPQSSPPCCLRRARASSRTPSGARMETSRACSSLR